MSTITPIVMPKWGLSMKEGTVIEWLVEEGCIITTGMPIIDMETDKLANAVEAPDPGILRRKVASAGDLLPVKALLGVMADQDVSDAEIDAYIAAYVTPVATDEEDSSAQAFQYIEVDGIRVRYVQKGGSTGTPVLLIHGYGGDLDNWLFNIDALSEKAPVIALDLPGHGQSAVKLPAGVNLVAQAGFVVHFLDAINVTRAHMVGHSMGAAIASQIALDAPQYVASLTLIGSAGLGAEINSAYIDGFANAQSRRELKPVLEILFSDPALVSRQLVDDVLRYKRLDGVGSLLVELGQALFCDGKQNEQPGLKLGSSCPALVIWGRDDRVIPVNHASNAPKGATVEILEGVGHMVQLERASEVNRLIIQHISA